MDEKQEQKGEEVLFVRGTFDKEPKYKLVRDVENFFAREHYETFARKPREMLFSIRSATNESDDDEEEMPQDTEENMSRLVQICKTKFPTMTWDIYALTVSDD